jgi:3-oxoacyl-[acyl-carrier protein] reductase
MSSLTGKIAIVTASSRGIGRAIAKRLSKDGAAIAVN